MSTTQVIRGEVEGKAINTALVKAQAEFPPIPKNRIAKIPTKTGGSYSYRYADLGDVLAAVVPVLNAHGIAVTQNAYDSGDGRVGVSTCLRHSSGETITFAGLMLPAGHDAQSAGSAITYARRYSLCAALGIAADEDDDGSAAKKGASMGPNPTPSAPVPPGGPSPSGGATTSPSPAGGQGPGSKGKGTGGSSREEAAPGACAHTDTSPLKMDGSALPAGKVRCIACGVVKKES